MPVPRGRSHRKPRKTNLRKFRRFIFCPALAAAAKEKHAKTNLRKVRRFIFCSPLEAAATENRAKRIYGDAVDSFSAGPRGHSHRKPRQNESTEIPWIHFLATLRGRSHRKTRKNESSSQPKNAPIALQRFCSQPKDARIGGYRFEGLPIACRCFSQISPTFDLRVSL